MLHPDHEKGQRSRRHHEGHRKRVDWIGNLSRQLSLPATVRSDDPRSCLSRTKSTCQPEIECPAQPVQEATARRRLSHRERHEINLMYHLLRDNRDALRLRGARLMEWQLLLGDSGAAAAAGAGAEADGGSFLWWWSELADGEGECNGEGDNCGSGAAGNDDSGECCHGETICRLKKCDSDSCLSSCSSSSKRFKHRRRTARWNQEFDLEFREKHGLVDRDYNRVYQIK